MKGFAQAAGVERTHIGVGDDRGGARAERGNPFACLGEKAAADHNIIRPITKRNVNLDGGCFQHRGRRNGHLMELPWFSSQ